MPRDTQTASLRSRALLVKFVARSWGASKADKEASTTLNAKSQAQEGASKVTKYLIPQENLSPIRRVSAAARKVVEFNSAPWADGGLRIIATSRFADLRAEMDKFEQTHNERVNDLMDDFHELTQPERLKNWLGDLASSTDIPDADTVRSKFKLGLEVLTVPEDNDFRIDLGEEDRKALSDSIEAQLTETMNASIVTVQTRIVDRVGALAKKMSTYDPISIFQMILGSQKWSLALAT